MATYYAIHAGGNWGTAGTWSTISAKDATRTGNGAVPTNADTVILDDWSGNVTFTGTGTCKNLDCVSNGNYAGTLALGANSFNFTTVGTLTLSNSMNFTATTGAINVSANITITSNSKKIPGTLSFTGTLTLTLIDDLNATIITHNNGAITQAGAFNITCDTFRGSPTSSSANPMFILFAGKTLTITTKLLLSSSLETFNYTLKTTTASSSGFLVYQGTLANQMVMGVIFTDIDASSSNVEIQNWKGGTLTRISNIKNYGSSDLDVTNLFVIED